MKIVHAGVVFALVASMSCGGQTSTTVADAGVDADAATSLVCAACSLPMICCSGGMGCLPGGNVCPADWAAAQTCGGGPGSRLRFAQPCNGLTAVEEPGVEGAYWEVFDAISGRLVAVLNSFAGETQCTGANDGSLSIPVACLAMWSSPQQSTPCVGTSTFTSLCEPLDASSD